MTPTAAPPREGVQDRAIGVSFRHVTKDFQSGDQIVRALDDVSFDLCAGESAALLGPSGSGKSTLLLVAGCLMAPTAGEVRVGGEVVFEARDGRAGRLRDDREFRRKRIGFVFQKAHLIPFLNAVENVQLAMEINDVKPSVARGRAMELLDYLGVSDRADHLPRQLSGGQQQRVAIARALANSPSLILADEPTAALDVDRGRQVMELFHSIAEEQGACVIVVTHDYRALEHFDRLLELENGRLTEGGLTTSLTTGARRLAQ
jgi:putative ABC transport system ATP-binding protein